MFYPCRRNHCKKELRSREKLRLDTGCLVAMTKDVHYDIEFVDGIKNTLFGGEGIFFVTLRGLGEVWIQSLPFSRLASKVFASAREAYGKQMGEGSVLGPLGNLFER